MKIELEHPFLDYKAAYLIFHKKMGRRQVCLVGDNKRRTILYSKFLMSISLGRELLKEEEVDHVDGDKLNDSIDNFEVVTGVENRRRSYTFMSRSKVTLQCPVCKKDFIRERRQTHLIKGGNPSTCSRQCGGIASHWHRALAPIA